MAEFKPTHRHYKGGLYQVLCRDVLHTETNEMLVIYQSAATIFARPQEMFESAVEVDGKWQLRFEPLSADDLTP